METVDSPLFVIVIGVLDGGGDSYGVGLFALGREKEGLARVPQRDFRGWMVVDGIWNYERTLSIRLADLDLNDEFD